jgi:hypothetical protein
MDLPIDTEPPLPDPPRRPANQLQKLLPFLVLLGFLPIGLNLISRPQNSAASAFSPFKRCIPPAYVAINPGKIDYRPYDLNQIRPIYLSTLAYDKFKQPIWDGITYEWSMSSTFSVGNLIPNGKIATFVPFHSGTGNITVYAKACNKSAFGSVPIFISLPTPIPTSTPTPTPNIARWIKVVSPNGGETLQVGNTYRIAWNSSPNIDSVYLGYSLGAGSLNWIATRLPNTGYYDWKIYIGNSTNSQIKIYVLGYQTGYGSADDYSDNFLTVLSPPIISPTLSPTPTPRLILTPTPTPVPVRWIQIVSPNGGEVLRLGETYRITWKSSSNLSNISLAYHFGTGGIDNNNWIATNLPNTGYYDWKVSLGNNTNNQVMIYIVGYQDNLYSTSDFSDNFFNVFAPI